MMKNRTRGPWPMCWRSEYGRPSLSGSSRSGTGVPTSSSAFMRRPYPNHFSPATARENPLVRPWYIGPAFMHHMKLGMP